MEQEQKTNTLDLDKLLTEKQRLQELIEPAVQQFVKRMELLPEIRISQISQGTRCGIVKGDVIVEVFVSI